MIITQLTDSRGSSGVLINYSEKAGEWVMTREGESQSDVLGRATASLLRLGTGLMDWRLREDVCDQPLARALMTVCKVVILSQQRV